MAAPTAARNNPAPPSAPEPNTVARGYWRRLLIAWLACASFMLQCTTVAHAQGPLEWSAPAAIGPIALEVSGDGLPTIAWTDAQHGSQPSILAATDPIAQPSVVVAHLADGPPLSLDISLDASQQPLIAWAVPNTSTVHLYAANLSDSRYTADEQVPLAHHVAVAVTDDVDLVSASVESDALVIADASSNLTHTIALGKSAVSLVELDLDDQAQAHVAWIASETFTSTGSLHYANTLTGTSPITVTTRAISPTLSLDRHGRPHLLWSDGERLLYAHGNDWLNIDVVAETTGTLAWDIAARDTGDVVVAWVSANGIWTAHSSNWEMTLDHACQAERVHALDVAVDDVGGTHLIWTESDPASEISVRYMTDAPQAHQCAITWPLEDTRLTSGDVLTAVTMPRHGWDQVAFYLEPVGTQWPQGWIPAGVDKDGADGWSGVISETTLPGEYRPVAVATCIEATRTATGPSFTLDPAIGGQVAFITSTRPPLRGQAAIDMMWLPSQTRPAPPIALDIYLRPETCEWLQPACMDDGPTSLHYAGQHTLYRTSAPNSTTIALNTHNVPDGRYTIVPREIDSGIWWPDSGLPLIVDNSMVPSISLVEIEADALLANTIPVSVTASDANGIIQRVDVFLERAVAIDHAEGETASVSRRIWAGADDTSEDGWHLDIPVQDTWRGQSWHILARATDADGNTWTSGRQEPIHVPQKGAPSLAILSPQTGALLRGAGRIVIAGQEPATPITITAYVENGTGQLSMLGTVAPEWPGWQLNWDTSLHLDGDYRLILVTHSPDTGLDTLVSTGWFAIANKVAALAFAEPARDETLSGSQILRLRETSHESYLRQVSFYWRDISGIMHHIDDVSRPTQTWAALWDTRSVLDGEYALLASIIAQDGTQTFIEKNVCVQNNPLDIGLNIKADVTLSGQQAISWTVTSPLTTDVTVDLAYSPDDGYHWLPLATGLTVDQPYLWDSSLAPDSTQARLRGTAHDGDHSQQSTSPRITVDNHDLATRAKILAPAPGQRFSQGELVVSWQVTYSDGAGQSPRVNLDYRLGESGWRTLVYDLEPTGHLVLNEPWLPTNQPFDLRLSTRDQKGITTLDVVEGIQLLVNQPPTIRILWPNAPVELGSEAIILWQANDPDDDPLSVDLYYSDNGGQSWLPLAENLDDTGYYAWQLAFLPPSDQYRLRAIVSDGASQAETESASVFSVGSPSQQLVSLISPQAGDRITGLCLFRWTTLVPSDQALAQIALRRDGEPDWQTHATLPNASFYLCDTAAISDGAYDLRVTISDTERIAVAQTSSPVVFANRTPPALGVAILAPQGSESLAGTHEIRWLTSGGDASPLTATLSVSADSGGNWEVIGKTDARAGHYVVRSFEDANADIASLLYSVAISDGTRVASDVIDSPVHVYTGAAYPPRIDILGPWQTGMLLNGDSLVWQAFDGDSDPLHIALWQSKDGVMRWNRMSSNLANTGMAIIDDTLPTDRDTQIVATATDGMMTISSPAVTVRRTLPESVRAESEFVTPRERETVSGEYEIIWDIDAPSGPAWQVSLDYSADGGLRWNPLDRDLELDQSMLWDSTSVPDGDYMLRLNLETERAIQRHASPLFAVKNGITETCTLSLLSPAGAETWMGLQDIVWRATGLDSDDPPVDLFYSTDRGATWTTIARKSQGGRYTWDTSRAPNCDEVWLKATMACGALSSQAISAKPVAIANLAGPTARLWVDGDSTWQGDVALRWVCQSQTGQPLSVSCDFSTDAGQTWYTFARNVPERGDMRWDTSALPARSQVILRITAYDRGLTAIHTLWEPITVNAGRPEQLPPFPLP